MHRDARAATVGNRTKIVSTTWAHQGVWQRMGEFVTEGSSVLHGLAGVQGKCKKCARRLARIIMGRRRTMNSARE